jgi:SAM-dependent methyltransferase
MDANRRLWDAWTPAHASSEFYDVDSFLAGRDTIDAVEAEGVGDVTGKTLLHLQCHFGLDTMSWARRGASAVTGVDFSHQAVALARSLASELDLPARFVETDVLDTLDQLDGERFDVVFTSHGALSWLADLRPWAEVVAGALKPGGTFFVAEHHPSLWVFDEGVEDRELVFRYGYFDRETLREEQTGSYAAPDSGVETVSYSWQHTFEELVGSLIGAGLRVTGLREYPYLSFSWFPYMEKGADGFWRLPAGMPDIPLMYSLTATRDA